MKQAAIGLFLLVMVATGLAEPVTIEGVAAYVNDSVITVGEVKEMMAPALAELQHSYQGDDLRARFQALYKDSLEDLIATRLILKAYDTDTKINKGAVEKHVEARVSQFIQDRFDGDRQEFMKALQAERMPMEEWRRRLRERIVVGLMRNREVDSHVVVSPRQVREFYEQNRPRYQKPERVKLSVIMVRGGTNETDRGVRQELARSVEQKVKNGADFAQCARQFSEDASASKGGEWGWLATTDVRKELAEPLARLNRGGTSGVVTMDGDFYLLKLDDRESAGVVPYDEVRTTIEKDLKRKESRRLLDTWIQTLKKDAYIKVADASAP